MDMLVVGKTPIPLPPHPNAFPSMFLIVAFFCHWGWGEGERGNA